MNRAEIIHANFIQRVQALDFPPPLLHSGEGANDLSNDFLVDLFETQVMSRLLDLTSRRLAARKESFYTIGSSGHEGNAALAAAFRVTDMAFLHYRDAAFLLQRSKQRPGQTPLFDMLLSFAASSEDPISGGRHKVLGSLALNIPPQTSTIASHLPKAVGAAHALGLKHAQSTLPESAVIVCSFGDASANHSTAQGAFNTACWASFQNSPMPIVFICEDNGIGISTPTPHGWIEASFRHRPGLHYLACNGLDVEDSYRAGQLAAAYARTHKKPVFLHMKTVRLTGHAGSDAEVAYRTQGQIEATEAQDPLLYTAGLLLARGALTGEQVLALYTQMEARIARVAEKAIARPKIASAASVIEPLVPPVRSYCAAMPVASEAQREALFATEKRAFSQPQHMAKLINLALADVLLQYPHTLMCGEDIGKKGGVYGVTQGLQKKFGPARVTDTLLDEQSILGLAIGAAHTGLLAIPEIQFLAYVHNAEDQIRGEAATLSFFSNGQYTNPMVIRIAGLGYQKGFGGHFHNDNSLTLFRDIPGVIVACPSNGRDAVQMLRTCVALAHEQRRVVVFLEPIALYMTRDLHEEGDGLWTAEYEPPGTGSTIALGQPNVVGEGKDYCIITYGNGFYLSQQAARQLEQSHQLDGRVIDLRWLVPLDENEILAAIEGYDRILIVDECRKSGSLSEGVVTLLHQHSIAARIERVTAVDSFIPLAAAANLVLPSVEDVKQAVLALMEVDR